MNIKFLKPLKLTFGRSHDINLWLEAPRSKKWWKWLCRKSCLTEPWFHYKLCPITPHPTNLQTPNYNKVGAWIEFAKQWYVLNKNHQYHASRSTATKGPGKIWETPRIYKIPPLKIQNSHSSSKKVSIYHYYEYKTEQQPLFWDCPYGIHLWWDGATDNSWLSSAESKTRVDLVSPVGQKKTPWSDIRIGCISGHVHYHISCPCSNTIPISLQ